MWGWCRMEGTVCPEQAVPAVRLSGAEQEIYPYTRLVALAEKLARKILKPWVLYSGTEIVPVQSMFCPKRLGA